MLVNSILVRDDQGEPLAIRTIAARRAERKSYERELMLTRDRERLAREQTERLQRITAAVAAAPTRGRSRRRDRRAVALGVEHAGIACAIPTARSCA